ncbi:ATP-binding cassette domain-containing protein [Oligoflexaceae bacterium]|nr:ATP-binding cassette domain-containing protein [Oligoflexaceae bacterium]
MIDIKGLVKEFGGFKAVGGLDFSIPKGQILGFLGPNGAGKSTTMKMITGFLEPTLGSIEVGGVDISTDPIAAKKLIGYLPESAPSYQEMSVEEFLKFVAEIRGFSGSEREGAMQKMREVCFLDDVWHQPIETLSKGYKQRVGFAQALIHDPPILVLDEPTDGLDPNQKHEVRQLIKRMGRDKTIILSTHILEEVEAICERVIIIAKGKIMADSTPEALLSESSFHNAVRISLPEEGLRQKVRQSLDALQSVDHVEELPGSLRVFPKDRQPIINSVATMARENAWPVGEVLVERGRLDEVFRKVTLGDGGVS